METLRFTRALFGLARLQFLLGGVVQQHLENCYEQYPKVVEEIERSLYVDDLISSGPTIPAARQVKETSSDIRTRWFHSSQMGFERQGTRYSKHRLAMRPVTHRRPMLSSS